MEQIWIMIDLRNGDKLLIGCIYLSPSGDRHLGITELDRSLSLAGNLSPSHILVVGDFNVPQIDWASYFSDEPPGHHSHALLSCVQDHFLTQHVTAPTRYRLGQIPSMLDLIFTNEEGMVQDLQHSPGLGLSDHVILEFSLKCYTTKGIPIGPHLNYNRANYNLLRSVLQDVDWTVMHDSNVHRAYHYFVSSLREAVARTVPVTHHRPNKNLYIDNRAQRLRREKSLLWNMYAHTRDPVDYARYCRCRNRLRKLTRELRRTFEFRLSKELKDNPKAFWKYSNSRLKTKVGIDALRDENGLVIRDDVTKASILNKYFSSVFTNGTGLSFMPEGLEKQVNVQAMADLLAYLDSIR